jgi:hypothetical protein
MADEQRQAMISATAIGEGNTFTALLETTTDLPPDAIGEVVVMALQRIWRAGEDPTKSVIVIRFGWQDQRPRCHHQVEADLPAGPCSICGDRG